MVPFYCLHISVSACVVRGISSEGELGPRGLAVELLACRMGLVWGSGKGISSRHGVERRPCEAQGHGGTWMDGLNSVPSFVMY